MGECGAQWLTRTAPCVCAVFVVIVSAFSAPEVRAAVRVCHDTVLSEIVTHTSEQAAKKAALGQWRAKARGLGVGYDGWHVAAGKALKCFAKEGGYECVALGRPCVIQHNPNQRPAGADRKGEPL